MIPDIIEEDITNELRNRVFRVPLIRYVFEAYTPYWGGGYTGYTFRCLDQNCREYEFLWQGSEEIRGRMRWLSRIVLASFVDDEKLIKSNKNNIGGYRYVEEKGFDGVLKKIFGSINSNKALSASFKIEALLSDSEVKPRPFVEYGTILNIIKRNSHNLFKFKRKNRVRMNISFFEESCYRRNDLYNDFFCLFSIPRFYLLSMKIQELLNNIRDPKELNDTIYKKIAKQIFEMQPARQGTLRFTLNLFVRPNSFLTGSGRPWQCFLAYIALLVPTLVGLGKGVTRGFGRFKLIDYEINIKDCPLKDSISKLKGATSIQGIVGIANELLKYTENLPEVKQEGNLKSGIAIIPRLSYALDNYVTIENPKHPCPYAVNKINMCRPSYKKPIRNELDLLSAIGKSVLKSVWKIYNGIPVRNSAPNLETWPLGLPRSQKLKGAFRGYLLFNGEQGRRLSNIFLLPTVHNREWNVLAIPLAAACDIPFNLGLVHVGARKSKIKRNTCSDVHKVFKTTLEILKFILS